MRELASLHLARSDLYHSTMELLSSAPDEQRLGVLVRKLRNRAWNLQARSEECATLVHSLEGTSSSRLAADFQRCATTLVVPHGHDCLISTTQSTDSNTAIDGHSIADLQELSQSASLLATHLSYGDLGRASLLRKEQADFLNSYRGTCLRLLANSLCEHADWSQVYVALGAALGAQLEEDIRSL